MRTIKILLTLVLLNLSYNSFANPHPNLPPPDGPGWGWNQGGGGGNPPPKPQGRVIYTWGALAQDSEYVGISNAEDTKEDAKKEAIQNCLANSKGDKNCQVIITFYNQCVAYAQSRDQWAVNSEATIDKAKQKALKACEKNTTSPGAKCTILTAKCTKTFFMHPNGRIVDY